MFIICHDVSIMVSKLSANKFDGTIGLRLLEEDPTKGILSVIIGRL